MNLDLQVKINNNPNLKKYLRENSHWYKTLNRSPETLSELINEMNTSYRLRPLDKVSNFLEQIELIQSILSILK